MDLDMELNMLSQVGNADVAQKENEQQLCLSLLHPKWNTRAHPPVMFQSKASERIWLEKK